MGTRIKIGVVVPCYNEEDALKHTIPVLVGLLNRMSAEDIITDDSYVLCVDDGSRDHTWAEIKMLSGRYPNVRGVALAHNRGHQYALLAGLLEARKDCDAAISIDADLQDEPEAIIEMVNKFIAGDEIVYGVRKSRATDTWFKRTSARMFYKLQSAMGLETIYDHADYRLMSKRALDILSEYSEQNLFLRGIVPQIGLKNSIVEYDRNKRVAGESKYPFLKMLSFSIDGITSFSSKPMALIFGIGFVLLALSIIVSAFVLVSFFAGHAVSGWTSLMLSVWFIGSLMLVSLGTIGVYIGKIFMEVKGRPRYNIRERIN